MIRFFVIALAIVGFGSPVRADWPTHRGNPQRTGSDDGKAGPKQPKVLWVFESSEHFIASPVAGQKELLVSGLGTFNTASLHNLNIDPVAEKREIWVKRPPYLKQAMACPPIIAEGKIIFGDGMHQTDGATLHCLTYPAGIAIWQLPVPGTLVHLEGSPAMEKGRIYIGGGAAGVMCVDANRVTINGRDTTLAEAQKLIETKWKELSEAYEKDKVKDPDFAIPPSEDALPKANPKLLWQKGKDKWHVDAAVTVFEGKVLVASAYLDNEKLGERGLICLDANTGAQKWERKLDHNPWGGASVAGKLALIGCSSIRFEPKDVPGQGEIVAADLENGDVKWKKNLPGGVVSPIAVADGLAIFTCADGKVRAVDAVSGDDKWTYEGKAAFFGGPAVGGAVAYAADLKGVVHAVGLNDGKARWTLDLAADPAVMAPGMVYGSPILHDGKVFVATCNIEAGPEAMKTVVVCIGEQ
ncbi:MAG TPA: PQQ-binding-like beta-propeller repeat protein [Tepidisphaeraceae bacterium]|nr:PQQ-binding-like beta-propeller repeat protein [Tepidisphaeraceae bacterium]